MEPTTLDAGNNFIIKLGDGTTHEARYVCRDGNKSRFHVFQRTKDDKILTIHEQYILNTVIPKLVNT